MTPADGERLIRQTELRAWALAVGANVLVLSTFFVGVVTWQPVHFAGQPLAPLMRFVSIATAIVIPIAALTAWITIGRSLRHGSRWMTEDRSPAQSELDVLVRVPRVAAVAGGFFWVAAPLWGAPAILLVTDYTFTPLIFTKVVVSWALLAVGGISLSYLVVERTLRPFRAMALSRNLSLLPPRTMGMVPRLFLAWAAAAAMPLTTIALLMFGTNAVQRNRSVPMIWFTCLVGLAVGITVTGFAARTITEPIIRVRDGLRRVGRGDLDAEIPVDEAGELSELQAGFNQMVSGLRERERMRDLFGRHVGQEVMTRALAGDGDLGGEQHHVTVMFVDVIGSTSIAESRDPDEVVQILNTFFDAVVRAVDDAGGMVNKFEGDAALCVFGAPTPADDHAARALRAAQELRVKLAALEDHHGVVAAIGVATGTVVAGNIGALDRYEFTVIGDAVNVAARLTEEAKRRPSRLLVSASAIDHASADGQWSQIGPMQLRGRSTPTDVYEPAASR
jgi:adenylate cyclase